MNRNLETEGASSRNWSLWTGWVPKLILIYDALDKDQIVDCSKEDVLRLINHVYRDASLEEFQWEPIRDNKFMMVRITSKVIHDREREAVTLFANQLTFSSSKKVDKEKVELQRVRLRACKDMAEILAGIIMIDDILVLSGGFDVFRERDNNLVVGVNYNRDVKTQIVRIPTNLEDGFFLYEGIVPTFTAKRFKFVYCAKWQDNDKNGYSHRTVTLHKNFALECTDIHDTHMYAFAKRKMPAPILRNYDPLDWYNLLINDEFTLYETEKEKKEREQHHANYLWRKSLFKAEKEEYRRKEQQLELRRKVKYWTSTLAGYLMWVLFIAMILILFWGSAIMTGSFWECKWKSLKKILCGCL